VLAHRLVLTPEAQMREATPDSVLAEVLDSVPVPTPDRNQPHASGRRRARSG
jgi:hypothetical protein